MFENLDPEAFEKELHNNPDAVVLDVRTAEEFHTGHLKNALNVDVTAPDFETRLKTLDATQKHLIYCRSGARSFNACTIMSQSGFSKVINMQGGIMSWRGPITS